MPNPIMTSDRQTWQTPPHILRTMQSLWGQVWLDPASCEDNPTGAVYWLTGNGEPGQDGLEQPWDEYGSSFTFVNPPYARGTMRLWAAKIQREGLKMSRRGEGVLVALLPVRTDTQWWHSLYPDATIYLEGRVNFIDPETGEPGKNGSTFPSALLIWGADLDPEELAATFPGRISTNYRRSLPQPEWVQPPPPRQTAAIRGAMGFLAAIRDPRASRTSSPWYDSSTIVVHEDGEALFHLGGPPPGGFQTFVQAPIPRTFDSTAGEWSPATYEVATYAQARVVFGGVVFDLRYHPCHTLLAVEHAAQAMLLGHAARNRHRTEESLDPSPF